MSIKAKYLRESSDIKFTNTGKVNQRLHSEGYYYIRDGSAKMLNKEGKLYWKCENWKFCPGRVHTIGTSGPVLVRVDHNHLVNIERSLVLENNDLLKSKAVASQINPRELFIETHKFNSDEVIVQSKNYSAHRQFVNRERNALGWHGEDPFDLSSYDIPDSLHLTHKNCKFY